MGWKSKSMGWNGRSPGWTHKNFSILNDKVAVRFNSLPNSAHYGEEINNG